MEITRLVKRAKRKDADAFTELMESQTQNQLKTSQEKKKNLKIYV